ncbi:MAG: holo-ACP synthase [Campylobacterales bacterium]
MIGIDLISIARIEAMIERFGERGVARFLSPDEIDIAKKSETIAGFWAAKEAIAKALGCGIGSELSFHDIILSKDSKGRPQAILTPEASARHGSPTIALSITHDGGFAAAAAIITHTKGVS